MNLIAETTKGKIRGVLRDGVVMPVTARIADKDCHTVEIRVAGDALLCYYYIR